MKSNLSPSKAFPVSLLLSCLTFLHSLPGHAQDDQYSRRQPRKAIARKGTIQVAQNTAPVSVENSVQKISPQQKPMKRVVLATPVSILAPQSGTVVVVGYQRSELRFKSSVGTSSTSLSQGGNILKTSLAAALNPNFYFGADLDYTNGETQFQSQSLSRKSTTVGMGDPSLYVGGRLNTGSVSTVFQLGATLSTGNGESKRNSDESEESNAKSGANAYTPQISVFTNDRSSVMFGGNLSYNFQQERTSTFTNSSGTSSTSKVPGLETLTVSPFVEFPLGADTLGTALIYSKSMNSPTEFSSQTSYVLLSGYGEFKFSRTFSLQPMLAYGQQIESSVNGVNYSQKDIYMGLLNARFYF